jgi:chemotaxis protein methyltransferase CheR
MRVPLTTDVRDRIRRIPGAFPMWRRIQRAIHWVSVHLTTRRNYLFTHFCRLPTQLDALSGPVCTMLLSPDSDREIRIVLFGSSIGAEPFSFAWALSRRQGVRFRIEAYDIEPEVVARARAGRFSPEEVTRNTALPPAFLAEAFESSGDGLMIKPHLSAFVRFEVGDVLDSALIARLGRADIVVAQNFLYHLSRPDAARALRHLCGLLKPQAALFVDGADLDLRSRLTIEAGLDPLPFEVQRIHEEARVERGYAWPRIYWGLEPFDGTRPDALRRYATIFVRRS